MSLDNNFKIIKENDININPNLKEFNIENIIDEIIINFKKFNLNKLHRIDEILLEQGIIENNKNIIQLCVITYTLRKLLSKKHITKNPRWVEISSKIILFLERSKQYYLNEDFKKYNQELKEIELIIKSTDNDFGYFVTNLVYDSRNKLASSVYGFGLSLSKACNLLDAKKEQVMNIIGSTKMSDEDIVFKSILDRVKYINKNDNLERT
jgi:hypothetical protein